MIPRAVTFLRGGVMVKVVRQDLFPLSEANRVPAKYVVLRKTMPTSENRFLEQILITPHKNSDNNHDNSFIVDQIKDKVLYDHIEDGDIGMLTGRGAIRVILSSRANHNTLLVTERCDNRCLFCSQPPKERDDDWLLVQAAMAIAAFSSSRTIGISGGEPLLYRKSFINFLDVIADYSPQTPLHILSNGRAFADPEFSQQVAQRCESLSITFGIPLYSSTSTHHDYLVGSEGAYRDTLKGLVNAGNCGIPIELRFIPTQKNFQDIETTVLLAARCLSNISQISIMNLEPTGWAKRNWNGLYYEPVKYAEELSKAILAAEAACLPIYLFNYTLCHLPESLRSYAVKSISDWKNYYPEECEGCQKREQCGGFFASSVGLYHQKARIIT